MVIDLDFSIRQNSDQIIFNKIKWFAVWILSDYYPILLIAFVVNALTTLVQYLLFLSMAGKTIGIWNLVWKRRPQQSCLTYFCACLKTFVHYHIVVRFNCSVSSTFFGITANWNSESFFTKCSNFKPILCFIEKLHSGQWHKGSSEI